MATITTPVTELFGIKHPVLLAGLVFFVFKIAYDILIYTRMNVAAGPELAAAVTNAGGLGVIGGVGYRPKILRQQVISSLQFLTPL
jgi:NAD(P)H-dependent flavin oxidoreductase YrpB (nitropropane dioxygenase family)